MISRCMTLQGKFTETDWSKPEHVEDLKKFTVENHECWEKLWEIHSHTPSLWIYKNISETAQSKNYEGKKNSVRNKHCKLPVSQQM